MSGGYDLVGARFRSPSPPPWLDKDRPIPMSTKLGRILVHHLDIHLVTENAALALGPNLSLLDIYKSDLSIGIHRWLCTYMPANTNAVQTPGQVYEC